MENINTHGLKMIGLQEASEETGFPANSGGYTELFYNKGTGEVWGVSQVSFGHNWHSEYKNPDIIKLGEPEIHVSAQEIADMIAQAMWYEKQAEKSLAKEKKAPEKSVRPKKADPEIVR